MGFFTDILKEVPLPAVLRERLTEADKKIDSLELENTNLRQLVKQKDAEIGTLKQENDALHKSLSDEPNVRGGGSMG